MALARATSPDGHTGNDSSGVTRTPFKFTALRPANCLATACKCFSTGLQSCATASLPLQNCLPVRTTVTSESGPLAGLPSPGPGRGVQVTQKVHAGDVMAGAGGAAGPAPEVRHQPAGTTINIYYSYVRNYNDAAGIAVKAS